MKKNKNNLKFVLLVLLLSWSVNGFGLFAADSKEFNNIIDKAKKQTVYFNAWGGAESINNYIEWAAKEVYKRYGVKVKHVKVGDIKVKVASILTEKRAGKNQKGSVDVMWINGENFKSMKENGLLYGPFTDQLPNYRLVDVEGKKSTTVDFSEPVEGMEAPWGMARLVYIYDQAKIQVPPKNAKELLQFVKKNPGMVTYPKPPDFHGTSFVKQLLLELVSDRRVFQQPVDKTFMAVTKPLWDYLDDFHKYAWRSGKSFPAALSVIHQLLDDGELLLSFSFNPNEASNLIEKGELPKTVRTYVHETGMLGNTHFLAIPFNSSAKEGAKVFINFLLSTEAQANKANPEVWGDPTVLAVSKLDAEGKNLFKNLPQGVATLSDKEMGRVLLEPHTSWVSAIEKEWTKRYGY